MRDLERYTKTSHFQRLAKQVAKTIGECRYCEGRVPDLIARHRTFARLGRELASDLEVVCGLCAESHPGRVPSEQEWEAAQGWPDLAVLLDMDFPGYEVEALETWRQTRSVEAVLEHIRVLKQQIARVKHRPGTSFLDPAVLESLAQDCESAQEGPPSLSELADLGLTPRQVRIVEFWAEGFTQEEMSTMLGVSQSVVSRDFLEAKIILKNSRFLGIIEP